MFKQLVLLIFFRCVLKSLLVQDSSSPLCWSSAFEPWMGLVTLWWITAIPLVSVVTTWLQYIGTFVAPPTTSTTPMCWKNSGHKTGWYKGSGIWKTRKTLVTELWFGNQGGRTGTLSYYLDFVFLKTCFFQKIQKENFSPMGVAHTCSYPRIPNNEDLRGADNEYIRQLCFANLLYV